MSGRPGSLFVDSNILIYAGLDAGFYQQQHLKVSIVTMAGVYSLPAPWHSGERDV